ncbi:MAG: hypothetical protein KGJ02_04205 [Verrucomicrobiota bacterium]|nr:hypothetical protein [Verrucomicrobiota bacterium]
MNFTREPIIETVITPREGCKLLVRNSKANGQEEYSVEAVEVVSFGHSFFFRSLERPKSFLVPVSDYEILELRETRLPLKNAPADRSIKIGGGRDAAPRPYREQPNEERPREESLDTNGSSSEQPPSGGSPDRMDRKRDRRRRGRRGGRDRGHDGHERMPPTEQQQQQSSPPEGTEFREEPAPTGEEVKAPSFISKLFPPPPTLIKETLGRYKTTESVEEELFPEPSNPSESIEDGLFDGHRPADSDDDEEKPLE